MRFFTDREIKIIGIVVGSATVLALVITVIVGLSRPSGDAPRFTENQTTTGSAGGSSSAGELTIWDLEIPDELIITAPETWHVYRESLPGWNDEHVLRFWIDPADIKIDQLQQETDALVDDFFESLP